MAAAAASSSTSCDDKIKKKYQYDVFLSFSGEDTRRSFVDHLNEALKGHGIRTFKDDERLQKGKEIKVELLKSIDDSRFSIIIFSKKYASSSWCLDELVKIMGRRDTLGQIAFPVFYDVEPTEVRKQSGSVGEAFAKHTQLSNETLGKWRKALKDAAGLSGWELKNTAHGHEAKAIKLIVEEVSRELRSINIDVDENLVGMERRMQDLDQYLQIEMNDVRVIGIKGMGGAGKTTLAQAVFDRISFDFEGKSFVENVREKSKASLSGLNNLQEQVLQDVLKDHSLHVSSVTEGKNLMKTMLCGKKVIVVLDDVDHQKQLEALVGAPSWFLPGSRIIITTRDEQILIAHGVEYICDVTLLSEEESGHLFNRYAFPKDIQTQEYETESLEVVHYAAGLPLTIRVLGSFLCGKTKPEWIDALSRLKQIPLKATLAKLELSYESLEDDYKEIFLDVACILRHWPKDDAVRMLESCGFHAITGLRVLEQKCLIKIVGTYPGGFIQLHDHIIEMGEYIVRREHPHKPKKHTRLWFQDEIEHVLANDLGTKATRCINLTITPGIVLKSFENMKKLRSLIVNYRKYNTSDRLVMIDEACRYFPNSLQYLYWHKYPHWCLPKTFEADNLVALEMSESIIRQLWEGGKVLKKLKFLYMPYTKLKSLDLGLMPNLERLDLQSCLGLVKLDVHGGCLKSLVYLNLSGCQKLKSFTFIEQFESLEVLHIAELNLKEFPDYITSGHSTKSLIELKLSLNANIAKVPSSIRNIHNLVSLSLRACRSLKILPGSLCSLQHLRTLNLELTSIEELPGDLGLLESLENLDLGGIKVKHLPDSLCMLKHLNTLLLRGCEVLEKLPVSIGMLESLEELDLSNCSNLRVIPRSICKLKCLRQLNLYSCSRIMKLPEHLEDLECLQELNIHKTGITHLPPSISFLKGLKICRSELKDPYPAPEISRSELEHQKKDSNFIQLCSKQGFQHLKTLDLHLCVNLENLPDNIGMLESLEKLNLDACFVLEKLPESIGKLESLRELDLSLCRVLKKLPESIGKLKSLEKLCLAFCFVLEKLPESIGKLESLQELDLSFCKALKKLPESIGKLKSLEKLCLASCFVLEKLPESIGKLESLQELDLSHCQALKKLPESIGKLESLVKLSLSYCYVLEKLPESIGKLESLQELDLSHCQALKKLPERISKLESLEKLNLTDCSSLIEIPSSISKLKRLKELKLTGCRGLIELPDILGDLECLQVLDIESTGITLLPPINNLLNVLKLIR